MFCLCSWWITKLQSVVFRCANQPVVWVVIVGVGESEMAFSNITWKCFPHYRLWSSQSISYLWIILKKGPVLRNFDVFIMPVWRNNWTKSGVVGDWGAMTPMWHRCNKFIDILQAHYVDVIMGAIASRITRLTSVYSTVYSEADQRKHQCSTSLAFVRGIHRGPVNSPHKWPVTWKLFPFDDVIMPRVKHDKWPIISMVCVVYRFHILIIAFNVVYRYDLKYFVRYTNMECRIIIHSHCIYRF